MAGMSKVGGGDSKNTLYCSFCGKSQRLRLHREGAACGAERLARDHGEELQVLPHVGMSAGFVPDLQ
jgi:hypothetical protein